MSSKVRKIEIPSVNARFLKDIFNPNDILANPGIYTTYSNTPAYPILIAMITTGLVELASTNYIDASTQQPIVIAGHKKHNGKRYKKNPDEKGGIGEKVSIPFRVSKQVISGEQATRTYTAGWEQIWWREVIQNSKDAKATIIDCGAVEQEDGNWLVWSEDNGTGMDLQTLVNSFLSLGGTGGKTESSENVGGFGKAKEILLLPWIYFRVHTQNNVAYSERATRNGDNFADITTGNERRKGTRLEVLMPASKYTTIVYLLSFLKLCNTPGITYQVTGKFNSEEIETKTIKATLTTGKSTSFSIGDDEQPASFEIHGNYEKFTITDDGNVKTEIIRDALLATAYIRQQPKNKISNQRLLIRDRGVFMFGIWINNNFADKYIAFVELEVPSKFVLSENRDGWRNASLQGAISKFTEDIARKQDRLFKDKNKLFFNKYYGEGGFKAQQRKKRKSEVEAAELMITAGNVIVTKDEKGKIKIDISKASLDDIKTAIEQFPPSEDMTPIEREISNTSAETTIAIIQGTKMRGPDQLSNIIKQSRWTPNFGVLNEIAGEQPPKKFFPDTMSPGALKLAKYWTEFVKWTFAQFNVYEEFNVGFVFTSDAQAMFSVSPNPDTGSMEKWVLLNPILLEPGSNKKNWIRSGKMLKPTDEEHLRLIYAAAIHECTHMETGLADEDLEFPVALTYNIAKAADFREVKKVAKTIVSSAISEERRTSSSSGAGAGVSATTADYGDLFYIEKSGKGRPKQIYSYGDPSQIEIKFMWESKPEDGWNGLIARIQLTVENTIIYSGISNIGDFLDVLFDNWWNFRYSGNTDNPSEILSKNEVVTLINIDDYIHFNNRTTDKTGIVSSRKFILVISKLIEDKIIQRLNFIVSKTRDSKARALRSEWKRVRG